MTIADFIDAIIPIFLGACMYMISLKQKTNTEKLKKLSLIVVGVGIILLIIKIIPML